eukprot:jgi/Bigna1/84977/estExt_fgenesh1_pg.C_10522
MDHLKVAMCIYHRVLKLSGEFQPFDDILKHNPFELGASDTSEYTFEHTHAQLMYMLESVHAADGDQSDFKMDFSLAVKPSTISAAGNGVFVQGKAIRGSVLALYPGLFAIPEHGPEVYETIMERNNKDEHKGYAIARMDSILLDAKYPFQLVSKLDIAILTYFFYCVILRSVEISSIDDGDDSTWPEYYTPETRRNYKMLASKKNPYAVGQYINHPQEQGMQNVQQLAFDFPTDFAHHLRPYIPTKLISSNFIGFGHRELASTIVYIATRDIEDEEIFVDYRLNPSLPYPEWYLPIDEEAARKRWT